MAVMKTHFRRQAMRAIFVVPVHRANPVKLLNAKHLQIENGTNQIVRTMSKLA